MGKCSRLQNCLKVKTQGRPHAGELILLTVYAELPAGAMLACSELQDFTGIQDHGEGL